MRILRGFFLFLSLCLLSLNVKAQFGRADVQVAGMTCSMCQMAVQKALKTIAWIDDIKPDLNSNSFQLIFKKDVSVNLDLIRKKIKDAGFSVNKLVATYKFNKMPVSNNSMFTTEGSSYRFVNTPDKVLNGDVKLRVLNSGFLTASEFKKYAVETAHPTYKTESSGKERIFYVTLVSN